MGREDMHGQVNAASELLDAQLAHLYGQETLTAARTDYAEAVDRLGQVRHLRHSRTLTAWEELGWEQRTLWLEAWSQSRFHHEDPPTDPPAGPAV